MLRRNAFRLRRGTDAFFTGEGPKTDQYGVGKIIHQKGGIFFELDKFLSPWMNHEMMGFVVRMAMLAAATFTTFTFGYNAICKFESRKPISQRWLPLTHDITLLERIEMEDGETVLLRFALPEKTDTVGWQPISSCEIGLMLPYHNATCWRWYTPISHPDQKGVIEFAVKIKSMGMMSESIIMISKGQTAKLGGFVKEFKYVPKEHHTIDCVMAGTGLTPALQLLSVMAREKHEPDSTKLRIMSCQEKPNRSIFIDKLLGMEQRLPFDRLQCRHVSLGGRWDGKTNGGKDLRGRGESGFISTDILHSWLGTGPEDLFKPRPLSEKAKKEVAAYRLEHAQGEAGSDEEKEETRKRKILVSGPGIFMRHVAGRAEMWVQGFYFRPVYQGILRDLGWSTKDVYSFAIPWAPWSDG